MVGMVFLLINPAIWFVDSIWGETHMFSIFLLLCSIYFVQRRFPVLAVSTLLLSVLTRPEMLAPAIVIALYLLFKYDAPARSVKNFALGIIPVFVILTPLMLAYSPSLPTNYYQWTLGVQTSSSPGASNFMYTSLDSYNLWPLFTGYVNGLSGHARLWVPTTTLIVGSLDYSTAARDLLLVLLAMLALKLFSLRRGQFNQRGLPLLAAGALSLIFIDVGIPVHYFVFTIPLLVLALRPGRDLMGYLAILAVTTTTFLGMWGSIPPALPPGSALSPAVNSATAFLNELVYEDWFITLGVILNLLALIWILHRALLGIDR
jgi:hypothetical protein